MKKTILGLMILSLTFSSFAENIQKPILTQMKVKVFADDGTPEECIVNPSKHLELIPGELKENVVIGNAVDQNNSSKSSCTEEELENLGLASSSTLSFLESADLTGTKVAILPIVGLGLLAGTCYFFNKAGEFIVKQKMDELALTATGSFIMTNVLLASGAAVGFTAGVGGICAVAGVSIEYFFGSKEDTNTDIKNDTSSDTNSK